MPSFPGFIYQHAHFSADKKSIRATAQGRCHQCHQYACAQTRTEEIAARVLKVELVTKPAEPSRIQLVTAAEQGVAGAGSTTRVSPNDRLLLVIDKRMYRFTGLRSEPSRFNTTFSGLRSVFTDTANNPVSGMQSMQIHPSAATKALR